MINILERFHFEWWQVMILLIAFRMHPVFKALATILVGRFVRPGLAKIALPLILSPATGRGKSAELQTPVKLAR